MTDVAKVFGRILGPKGKMPNPKLGCVLPPNADLKPLYDKLQTTLRIAVKSSLHFQCRVGKEDDDPEKLSGSPLPPPCGFETRRQPN
mgnify:FL=1